MCEQATISLPLVTQEDKIFLPNKTGSIESLPKFIKNITERSTNKLLCGLCRTFIQNVCVIKNYLKSKDNFLLQLSFL